MIRPCLAKRIFYTLIFFHLNQTISSYTLIDINDLPETKLVYDFVNDYEFTNGDIKKPRFEDTNEIINENEGKEQWNILKNTNYENNNYKHKLLVKKIVPHGIAPSGIEYDHKFNTAYKPLVRVHNTKTINQFFNEIIPQKYGFRNKNTKQYKVILITPNDFKHKNLKMQYNLNDKYLLQPFEIEKSDFDDKNKRLNFGQRMLKKLKDIRSAELLGSFGTEIVDLKDKRLQLVRQIQKKIKGIKSEAKRISAYAKVINVFKNMLRSPQIEKSGEANDPLAPGKADENQIVQKKPKKWVPHYPPWNYWTYKKTIHEDVCPGEQVKIGNMCIWIPPH